MTEGVVEAFDQPYKTKTEKSDYGDVDMLARLPDGTNLSIMFNKQQNNEGEETIQVEFYRNNSQEVTGEGDAQKIFATVLTSIQKYIKKYKPARLSFSASKATDPTIYYEPDQPQPNPESRAKLYDRLVQRYARAWGYRAFRADTGDLVIYELSRLQPAVTEGLAEGKQFNFGNFVVTLGPHAIDQTIDRQVDPRSVERILQNINQVRSSIMGQPVGAAFILHDGHSTGLGMRRHDNNRLTLATVYSIRPGFTKGKHPTFKVNVDQQLAEGKDQYGNFDPPGPEFKPTMPKGTVRVNVSDVYDWYKLGKNISNLDQAKASDFGKGPPSTIVSFGDEDTEHKYINALKKLGLDTTDIDPVDPNQPPGMKRQKTDPTFNVAENFADGKVKGKSRPGRVKKAGASCNGSVTSLRQKAKASSGERAKMYHWCANMKSGRKK
jgi:hypothetical protein